MKGFGLVLFILISLSIYAQSSIVYDSVPYKEGYLSVIINQQPKIEKAPAVLIIPGYTCSSIDRLPATHPYQRIVQVFEDNGYVVLRIEKSGLGKSSNTPPCESCDLHDEVENFELGLQKLKSLPYVDTNKIVIFGHSMGGIIAPALSAKHDVAGVVVYGTTAKSWFEYQIEMYRVQGGLAGMNPYELENAVRDQYELNYRFFIQKEPLEQIAKTPVADSILRTEWLYDQSNKIFGRNANYWRQIQDFPHYDNWKNTTAKVLVLHGSADFQAFSKSDHEQISAVVNAYHPGNGTFLSIKNTDHYFANNGDMQTAFDLFAQQKYKALFDGYNPEVGQTIIEWANKVVQNEKNSEQVNKWLQLPTENYPGKQDDIVFVNAKTGWYVNGFGAIYKTTDGGQNWIKIFEKKGTFFRCIAFLDSLKGFVGTVGTDYFPNVTDTIPLYQTTDGGLSWQPVSYSGPYVKGLCAIDVVTEPIINHGQLSVKNHIYAVGRVGSPANLLVSHDNGLTWTSCSVKAGQMLFDIKMFDVKNGLACSASSNDISKSHALILRTQNGGKSWQKVYESNRPFETTWKMSFPNDSIGYATIQSYNPDTTISQQGIIKTTNGGKTWQEFNLVVDHQAREFGIGFIDEKHGFVGTMRSGYETKDGGLTWSPIDLGIACNKIRFYDFGEHQKFGISIGKNVYKLNLK